MGQQIEDLARFVATTRCDDIPAAVLRHAKLTLLDTLGVILAGGERPEMRQLRAVRHRRNGRHRLCPRLARARYAHCRSPQRHRR